MFEIFHTFLHLFGLCPEQFGIFLLNDYIESMRYYKTLLKGLF
jgi:hypothetical protein